MADATGLSMTQEDRFLCPHWTQEISPPHNNYVSSLSAPHQRLAQTSFILRRYMLIGFH